ncbi:MAG: primosomal protein N' [Acidobacteria bacterium 13_1_40CM_2_60_7]|nr:MAG: primosomal protein N' [Acidobacteria bacterium 13_1_40CM_4_61_5]OLD62328.1 MAG: primosomal protein N' [Acidobacteria bacterium 13_1_40CM_2_60_7]OLE87263.1 MAG: primosomal protein N' [Acidobacteria bacterium 13_1_20CM_2_60_10]
MSERFCDVALPVPLPTLFTYSVPAPLCESVQPGSRVLVPFRRKAMVGVVVKNGTQPPAGTKIRPVERALDLVPALPPALLDLGDWIADYYLARPGEVFRAMLPPATELRARRELRLTEAGRAALTAGSASLFPPDEHALLQDLLNHKGARLVASGRKQPAFAAVIPGLLRRGLVELREVVHTRKRRTQRIVSWKSAPSESALGLSAPVEKLRHILEHERGPLPLPVLSRVSGVSPAVIKRLLKKGVLESWEEPIDPGEDPFDSGFTPPTHELSQAQQSALNTIRSQLDSGQFAVSLLFGVTGSGKTEVYLRSIQETLARGKTAIVLVPEIALTLWIGRLCRAWFGARYEGVAVLHSALSDVERAREWWRVRNGEARVVVGTRSAVFAPLENLGLIIVDEEQENSYKQEETPRYHGRDVAIVRAKQEGAVALLGSATPSLESFQNARSGKYELLTLPSRVENRPLAPVEIVDLRDDFRETHSTSPISAALRRSVEDCLANRAQALILINRRGYSWFVLCRSCGASVQCANCSISMAYHKQRNRLECHYCGSIRSVPEKCPKCDSQYLHFFGEGSEHLEERLRTEFPGVRVARLDRDTARTKRQYQQTLSAFAAGALDILVGTQMVAKGHDFHRVTLVGVVSADATLSLPDFRAAERAFQLLTQVAGRAGRGELPGRVLVQTFYPDHYAIRDAARQDYEAFFERELHFRKMMAYPPFTALANIIVRDKQLENAIRWSRQLSEYFAPHDGQGIKILGPAAAPLMRLKREHRFQFLLKSPKRSLLGKLLHGALAECEKRQIPASAMLVDVDPLSLL